MLLVGVGWCWLVLVWLLLVRLVLLLRFSYLLTPAATMGRLALLLPLHTVFVVAG